MLYYITHANLPTKKAFGYAVAKMCSTFANTEKVTLVIPKKVIKEVDISEDLYAYYGIPNNFSVIYIPVIQAAHFRFLGDIIPFLIEKISFSISVFRLKIEKADTCYSRDILPLLFLRLKTAKLFLEIHYLSKSDSFYIRWIRLAKKIIVITSFLKEELIGIGYNKDDIHIAPDAVDLTLFDSVKEDKYTIRNKLGLPNDKKIVLYLGNLFPWKGVYNLVDSFQNLSDDIVLVIVGGSDDTLPQFRQFCANKSYSDNIVITGYKKHEEISHYLKSADILVIPNSAKERISKYNTSPLKLFEYMASGVPILASDLPSLREVLNEGNATFFQPDDPVDLGNTIKVALADVESLNQKSKQALIDVQQYTWEIRARNILKFIHD